jgi:hypothetical protein
MKSAIQLLSALVGASLALTACGGAMTEQEAMEAEALAQSEAALSACTNWSEWSTVGTSCEARGCGFDWVCGGWADGSKDAADGETPEGLIPYCEDGSTPIRVNRLSTYNLRQSYRVCFDAYGNYTHTEYMTDTAFGTCGC